MRERERERERERVDLRVALALMCLLPLAAVAETPDRGDPPGRWVVNGEAASLEYTAVGETALVVHTLTLASLNVTWEGEWMTAGASTSIPLSIPVAALVDEDMTTQTVMLRTRLESPSGPIWLEPLALRLTRAGSGVQLRVLPKVASAELTDPAEVYNTQHRVIQYNPRLSAHRVDLVLTAADLAVGGAP